ncbi:MAG: hypothetical protein GY797_11260 [Deltaproteobacteria bacterium]|nr:hypothetical protein [Deltaproteobacteria bacterium]
MNDITDDDKLWAALTWVIWPLALVILFSEDRKDRPFQKYHAVNSLAFGAAFIIFIMVISTVTFGIGSCLAVLGFVVFYWAYKAYQGEWVEVPVLTNFVKGQGWI